MFVGLYIPYFYIQLYGIEDGVTSSNLEPYLLPLINAGSLFGRILSYSHLSMILRQSATFNTVKVPNYIADKVGPLNSLLFCCLICAILGMAWITIHTAGGIIAFCLLYGFFSGGFLSLSPTVVVSLCLSLEVVGVRMGMLFGPCSIGFLIGNLIAGALLRISWWSLQAFCGAMLLGAACFLLVSRVAKDGFKCNVRS